MRILFTGGGTLGPVTPLLSVAQALIEAKESTPSQMYWIGTPQGPEKELIQQAQIAFSSIQSGKIRRYFSIKNFSDPFFLFIGIIQSIRIIRRFKPDIIMGAGGYVQVPVIWAGWLLKKKSVILQLDIVASLSNVICANMVDTILLGFAEQEKDFSKRKTVLTGLPIRTEIRESKKCSDTQKKNIGLDSRIPTIFITGGGTGAQALNDLVVSALPQLVKHYNVVHITGKDKRVTLPDLGDHSSRYQQFLFLSDRYASFSAAADIVVTRGGMGSLSEFASLKKPMIVIPIPSSQQEKNAEYFEKKGGIVWRKQDSYTASKLIADIVSISTPARYERMQEALTTLVPRDACIRIITALRSII